MDLFVEEGASRPLFREVESSSFYVSVVGRAGEPLYAVGGMNARRSLTIMGGR